MHWVDVEYSPESDACLEGSVCEKAGLESKREGKERKRGKKDPSLASHSPAQRK